MDIASTLPAIVFPERSPIAQSGGTSNGFAASLDSAAVAIETADAKAAAVALGRGSIADASIARAKADVMLEVAAVAASRISGAVTTLMQTQV